MKRKYEAPVMSFEDFELSMNIAAGCTERIDTHANGSCALNVPGIGNVFTSTYAICSDFKSETGEYDGYCYDVPFGDNRLFNS